MSITKVVSLILLLCFLLIGYVIYGEINQSKNPNRETYTSERDP